MARAFTQEEREEHENKVKIAGSDQSPEMYDVEYRCRRCGQLIVQVLSADHWTSGIVGLRLGDYVLPTVVRHLACPDSKEGWTVLADLTRWRLHRHGEECTCCLHNLGDENAQ
jgi:hypothetical protein